MDWHITVHTDESAYRQIADYIRTQVAVGQLKPDTRLPAIRELARELQLDPGTVARAYRELEREGTIVTRYGKGSYIATAIGSKNILEQRQKKLSVIIEKAILEALALGYKVEDIETAFTLHLAAWRERSQQSIAKGENAPQTHGKTIRFAGSHDLAVELLAVHLKTLYPGIYFATNFTGSLAGLMALERNEADIAGAHLFDEETGDYNITYVKKLIPNEDVVLINLVQRIQGLMVIPGNPKHILNVSDLARADITFVNRQKGSGTRILLDAQLRRRGISTAKVKGYNREETTHSAVAGAIVRGDADIGLGAQSAAGAAGLDFIPLVKERYDLIMLEDKLEAVPFNMIPEIIRSETFRTMLTSLPGYDTSETGMVFTVNPGKSEQIRTENGGSISRRKIEKEDVPL